MKRVWALAVRDLKRLIRADKPPGKPDRPNRGRPTKRAHCERGVRPCPWVSCRYNLFLDIKPSGAIAFNFGTDTFDELPPQKHTCALDVADEGLHQCKEVAPLVNLTKNRVNQIEHEAIARLRQYLHRRDPRGTRPEE